MTKAIESWINVSQISMDDEGRMNTDEIKRIYTTMMFVDKQLMGMKDFIPYSEPMMLPLSYSLEEASISAGLIVGAYLRPLVANNPLTIFKLTAKVYSHSVEQPGDVGLVETFVQRSDDMEME